MKVENLCYTIAGNECPILNISNNINQLTGVKELVNVSRFSQKKLITDFKKT
jgi:hypothetical protein